MESLTVSPESGTPKRRPLATAQEVADRLRLPLQTTYELGRRGELPGVVRIGRRIRFDLDKLEAWLEGHNSGESA